MRTHQILTLCGALMALGLAGCQNDTDDTLADPGADAALPADTVRDQPNNAAPAGTPQTGEVAPGTLMVVTGAGPGPYIADSAGNALYTLEDDTDGSKCRDECLQAWPPLLVGEVQPAAGPQLQAGLVGTWQRPDGTTQVTYNGHMLHRYAADTGTGRTAGQGVEDQWGEWYLLTPAGELIHEAEAGAGTGNG